MEIVKNDKYSFKITVSDVSEEYDAGTKVFIVHPTTMSGEKFLAARPKSKKSGVNYLYIYKFSAGNLVTYSCTFTASAKEKMKSTEDLRKVMEARIKDDDHEEGELVWKKK